MNSGLLSLEAPSPKMKRLEDPGTTSQGKKADLRNADRLFVTDESISETSVNSNLSFMRLCCQGNV